MSRLVALIYFTSMTLLITFGLGLCYSRIVDVTGPGPDDRPTWSSIGFINGGLLMVLASTGVYRWRKHARRFWFGNLLFVVWLPLGLGLTDFFFRRVTPAWPAQALHGVSPDVARRAWGATSDANHSNGSADPKAIQTAINAWGQRDRERDVRPGSGVYRIAFIGDSFLEESSVPVSLLTEQLLARKEVEIINLGVSSTQPDEYYYRLRTVAVPLGCQHCVVWLFSGNDFVDEPRTLHRRGGMFAVAPRPAWATAAGLRAINHLMTNSQRPVIQAWFSAGDLAANELQMFNSIRQADDDALRNGLLHSNRLPEQEYKNLQARLNSPESTAFLAMLKSPDAGKFRSYYLTSGLWAAAAGNGQWDPNPETQALYWAREMVQVCQAQQIGLTFVVIPEAFQVDSRMREQWAALADMRHLTRPCRDAADRFCRSARTDGLDVLDLHPVFEDISGTYLNLDGHWSEKGVALAAEAILDHLKPQLPPAPLAQGD
jgi:hypothetical protein